MFTVDLSFYRLLRSESYDEAITKQNKAQMTSDLSADESLNDRPSRHQRCLVEFGEHEAPAKTTKARSKRSQVTTVSKAALPLVPLPIGLQNSGMHSNCYPIGCYSDDVYLKTVVCFSGIQFSQVLFLYSCCLVGLYLR
jgi:hypothetical protein